MLYMNMPTTPIRARESRALTRVITCVLILLVTGVLSMTAAAIATAIRRPLADTQYRMYLRTDTSAHAVQVTAHIRWRAPQSGIREIPFTFHPLAYAQDAPLPWDASDLSAAYPNGPDYADTDLHHHSASVPAEWYTDRTDCRMLAKLQSPLRRGQEVDFLFVYTLRLPRTNLRLGYSDEDMRLAQFYPQICPWTQDGFLSVPYAPWGDPIVNECADYLVDVLLSGDYAVAASGKIVSGITDRPQVTFEAQDIRDFALVMRRGTVWTDDYNGIALRYLPADDPDPSATMERIKSILSVYESLWGEYPYESLSAAQAPFAAGGMEYGGMIVLAQGLSPAMHATALAHEIAHQWWQGDVGSDAYHTPWQDESLAQYATYRYFRAADMASFAQTFADAAQTQYAQYIAAHPERRGILSEPLEAYPNATDYIVLIYDKGLLLWLHLERQCGSDLLDRALRRYRSQATGTIASPETLLNALDSTRSGLDEILLAYAAQT